MGYTVYWEIIEPLTKEEIEQCVSEIRQLNPEKDIIVFDEFTTGNEYDTQTNVDFNGIGDDFAHETFGFGESYYTSASNFHFCKTARKPYDHFVKKALCIIQRITNFKLRVTCDGINSDTEFNDWYGACDYNGNQLKDLNLKQRTYLNAKYILKENNYLESGEQEDFKKIADEFFKRLTEEEREEVMLHEL